MEYRRPDFLSSGDMISIVAPAGKLASGDLDAVQKELIKEGFEVKLGDHLFLTEGYFAASDVLRLKDLQQAIDDPKSKAIICARGGYGTSRIIDQVNLDALMSNPKWIIGFSDITALHLKLNKALLQSVHGPMGTSFKRVDSKYSTKSLISLLQGQLPVVDAKANHLNRIGIGSGTLIGGNLAMVVDSLGTQDEIETHNKILFLEDTGEPVYKIDRMMTQLLRAGKLNNIQGLVIGDFSETEESGWPQVFLERVSGFDYPVAFDFPIGHEPQNMPVVIGAEYNLEVSQLGASLKVSS